MDWDSIAKVCHEANKAYCESIGDFTQKPWDDAPAWQRESALSGVTFHAENPLSSARGSHENWLREKTVAGWKWGPVKNEETKEHPCFIPYDDLPIEQRKKDALFVAIVKALL